MSTFPEKNRYENVWFNVISFTRGWPISRPRNSIFFGGSKLLLPGARPDSKTNFVVAKYAMKIY